MKASPAPSPEDERLQRAAAFSTWLSENGQETSPALEAWLEADDENRRVWARRAETWNLFEQHVASPELIDLRRRALDEARRAGRKRWNAGPLWKPWATAAGVAGVAVAAGLLWYQTTPDTYATTASERRALKLPDGSQVHLDARTKLRVEYSSKSRELVLLNGQARFDVARDVLRPFSVLAAGTRVVATGTAFNVDLMERELRVTLIDGRVAVLDAHSAQAARPQIELEAGQQLQLARAAQPKVVKADVQRTTAWEGGKLVFNDEPLFLVVERVNRYTDRKISVADASTGDLRMSGVFTAGDLDTFLSTVTGYLGVKSQASDGGFLLTRGL